MGTICLNYHWSSKIDFDTEHLSRPNEYAAKARRALEEPRQGETRSPIFLVRTLQYNVTVAKLTVLVPFGRWAKCSRHA
jgi:hypothetical protein